MLKRTISKDDYETLSDEMKGFYVASKGKYSLDVEVDPQIEHLSNELSTARTSLKSRENFIDPATVPDTKELTKQLSDEKNARASDIVRYQKMIGDALIEEKASSMASKISKSPALMKRVIKDSLIVDFDAEKPSVKVRGEDGNVSDTSFDDLEKNIIANPDYSDIIIGTKASGGATQTSPAKKSYSGSDKPDLIRMSPDELAEYMKSKKN